MERIRARAVPILFGAALTQAADTSRAFPAKNGEVTRSHRLKLAGE